ncbi:GNAT family N-acetyltransferase [Corynebacterium sp.]|uniref:GNAT family N-acetyltransferase n=1 Tax=Corynebacterium sp. TaxID=1720 RepID=UPI002A90A644|nr:GNAT family N-acetyltransferase [Corynebacterium sp.]MDY5786468.1 GNAT family N-acetyltransferase [Corynebacterium sp.]
MTCVHTTAGMIRFRPLSAADRQTLHAWVTDPRSRFWGELDSTPQDIEKEIARLTTSPHEHAFILERDGVPLALTEVYDPAHVLFSHLSSALPLRRGDVGMHLLCAPPQGEHREHGLTTNLMAAVVAWLFDAPSTPFPGTVERILVEPDVRNERILAKNALAGFRTLPGFENTDLGDKTARLQAVERSAFHASPLASHARLAHLTPPSPAAHLGGDSGRRAQNHLVAKALRELIHERILHVEPAGAPGEFRTRVGGRRVLFRAAEHPLEHYSIDPASVRDDDGGSVALVPLIADAASELGIPATFVHTYLEDLSATLAGRARTEALSRPSVAELSDAATTLSAAEYLQYIESSMVGGHPGFIANSGNAGMSEAEACAFVPEMGRSTALVWVAVRREAAHVASLSTVDAEQLIGEQIQLPAELSGADYVALPLHPWQWENKVTTVFASALLRGDMVYLGEGADLMHPQQSMRTFFNMTRPELPYVKTAVAVRNLGFTRGLSPKYMSDTPAINEWLGTMLDDDPDLQHYNVRLLKEIASIGFTGDVYHRTAAAGSAVDGPHQKMIAALWRESPVPRLRAGNRAVTMAAVLHTDPDGRSLAAEWIARSGLGAAEWVSKLCDVYLRPAIRALAEYDIAFMPHSENVILELDSFTPVGSFFKDLGEEVAVVNAAREVPAQIARIQCDNGTMTDEERVQSIHTDIVDGVLRHLGALLSDAGCLGDDEFWGCVRSCVERYWADHPRSGRALPLLAEDFAHSCLNRLQLRNPETMVNLSDPNSSLLYAGRISNPLA